MTVRVAVVDSGINPDHPHVAQVKGGVFFDKGIESLDFVDRLGDGTAVAAVIHEKRRRRISMPFGSSTGDSRQISTL